MLPVIEIFLRGTGEDSALRFQINGHWFSFRGNAAERYGLERDLLDARKLINAARALKSVRPKRHGG